MKGRKTAQVEQHRPGAEEGQTVQRLMGALVLALEQEAEAISKDRPSGALPANWVVSALTGLLSGFIDQNSTTHEARGRCLDAVVLLLQAAQREPFVSPAQRKVVQ